MKKWEVTYKNLNIVFGNNVFTKVMDGASAEEALRKYAMENEYILEMIDYKKL